jgi:hypothetical protein
MFMPLVAKCFTIFTHLHNSSCSGVERFSTVAWELTTGAVGASTGFKASWRVDHDSQEASDKFFVAPMRL